MNAAERNCTTCEQKTTAVVLALRKFRIYLLFSQPIELITDHQAPKYGFKKKDVYGRLARWIYFLAEYESIFKREPGSRNQTADYLSLFGRREPVLDKVNKGELAMIVAEADQNLQQFSKRVRNYLFDATASGINCEIRSRVKGMAKPFLVWYWQLFQQMALAPNIFASMRKKNDVLTMFHDCIGHWDTFQDESVY